VGHGQSENLILGSPSQGTDKRIIVSRSHTGDVADVAKETLGAVEITPAGGAGKTGGV